MTEAITRYGPPPPEECTPDEQGRMHHRWMPFFEWGAWGNTCRCGALYLVKDRTDHHIEVVEAPQPD